MEISFKDVVRFHSKIRINPETWCWEWNTCQNENGYGYFGLKGRNWRSHRFSYLIHVGDLMPNLIIDHLCNNKLCCNPVHLEQITQSENIRRGNSFIAQQARQTHCKRGHPLSGTNLYITPDKRRNCRICRKLNAILHK